MFRMTAGGRFTSPDHFHVGARAQSATGDGNGAFTFIGADAIADLIIQVTLPDATPIAAGDFIL